MYRHPFILLVLVCPLVVAPAAAQWPPERFENLQVLPDSIPQQQLFRVMGSFTRELGVRCAHCHVGEENIPLSEFDFPSDDKVAKRKAREMLRMVNAINGQHLASVEDRADPPVRVRCVTCHAGRTIPREIEDVVLLAYDRNGLDSALATYRGLRDRYYGRAAYDFGGVPLTVVADTIQGRGFLTDAIAVHALNVEMNPTSAFAKRRHGATAMLYAFLEGGVDAGVDRYRALRAEYGQAGFPESSLNRLGYILLRSDNPAEAVAVFKLAVDAFPESSNVYDSLGEGYAVAGDVVRAIAAYERSLELDPENENARTKLRELRARS